MTFEGRKFLVKWVKLHEHGLIFPTRDGNPLSQRNLLREFGELCAMAGISGVRKSWHTLRHTFAKAYITSGGDVFSLRRVLGHSSLEMTMKYVDMQTEDLKAKHTQHARLLAGK